MTGVTDLPFRRTVKRYGKRYMRRLGKWGAHVMHSLYALEPVDLNDFALARQRNENMTAFDAMTMGTAGFTAALASARRVPLITRLSMSRPRLSVPIQKLASGVPGLDEAALRKRFERLKEKLTRLARERGLRGIVLKNHFESTAALAFEIRRMVPNLEVFGGIVLNRSVGGINPVAVERMARLKGGYGRIVWMPTNDAEHQVRNSRESRPFVAISRDGRLLPSVLEVLDVIARYKLVLATGHSSPHESLLLIREAKARGVRGILVTHPQLASIGMSIDQMKQAAAMGELTRFEDSVDALVANLGPVADESLKLDRLSGR